MLQHVHIPARSIAPFVDLIGAEKVEANARLAAFIRKQMGSARIWNISSTAVGGGVAEMLRSLLRYACGLGIDVRWLVLEGTPEFFRVTKRIHNALHEDHGDGSPLGPQQRELYEKTMQIAWRDLETCVRAGDVVVCHDPQTAGLAPYLARAGALVIWRCHIGHDHPGPETRAGWDFLRKYLEQVPLAVFSRESYAPTWIPRTRFVVLPPNIDPFSVKNQWMPETVVWTILAKTGLILPKGNPGSPVFVRDDGTVCEVSRPAVVVREGGPPPWDTPLVTQVSRWDRMKDPIGVLESFRKVKSSIGVLVLAGPMVYGVRDDPEAPEVFDEVHQAWKAMPEEWRKRVHLVQLPIDDNDENAAIVNALQRHSTIIVQKSIREGFGLTVTEGMWKQRPVVASAIGGIPDQIRDGIDGILLRNPADHDETANAIDRLLGDPELAKRLGHAGYERVRHDFLAISALERWAEILRAFFM
jgi:trehalose synthase